MAKPVSEEELQLKKRARRRLVGAIVLVAVVAVVLPMVLDTEPKSTSQEINIQIPSPDSKGFTSKVVPLSPTAKPAADLPAKAEKAAEKSAEKAAEKTDKAEKKAEVKAEVKADAKPPEAPPAPKAKPVEKPAEKTTPKPAPAAPKAATESKDAVKPAAKPAAGTYFIQVTALSDADKVAQVQKRMADAGVRSYTETVSVAKGKVTRVRAGPFKSKDEADSAREKLQKIGFEGKVAAN